MSKNVSEIRSFIMTSRLRIDTIHWLEYKIYNNSNHSVFRRTTINVVIKLLIDYFMPIAIRNNNNHKKYTFHINKGLWWETLHPKIMYTIFRLYNKTIFCYDVFLLLKGTCVGTVLMGIVYTIHELSFLPIFVPYMCVCSFAFSFHMHSLTTITKQFYMNK